MLFRSIIQFSSLNFRHPSLTTHYSKISQFLITPFGGLFGWNISSQIFKSNTHLYVTHWVPDVQNGHKPTRIVSLSLSLSSSRPFHNKTLCPQLQHSLTSTASPLSHHRSSALQTLTPPLIFCPSLLCLPITSFSP